MRRLLFALFAALPLASLTAACGDSLQPTLLLAEDTTVVLTAPVAPASPAIEPSALDVAGTLSVRFPELPADADAWDFALRLRDGQLRLVPLDPPAGTRAPRIGLSAQPYASLERAPSRSDAYGDTAVVLAPGATYVLRSRSYSAQFFSCTHSYAKVQVRSLDVATATARLSVTANGGCTDERLVRD